MVNNYLNQIRHEFASQSLDLESVEDNPINQLEKWITEAVDSQLLEPNAMSVSTVSTNGEPTSRVVYLRGLDDKGLRFYTNYLSRKGQDVESHHQVALLFFHAELERQVRVNGRIEKLSEEESDAYFNARPVESKLGAWASEQSQEIASRQTLKNRLEEFRQKFSDDVPRPPHWGGYLVVPHRMEFWQGRPARLHDRMVYTLEEASNWTLKRLAP
ncbi:pyridoxamine 5'-phosphate oxidase [bacterium SCSIO 12741]|nr:pyridoxamine 5'-phosphate oxidase [bacterium SCSIO 12741]